MAGLDAFVLTFGVPDVIEGGLIAVRPHARFSTQRSAACVRLHLVARDKCLRHRRLAF